MKTRIPIGFLLAALMLLLTATTAVCEAGNPELHQGWADLLDRHVTNGVVDYQGFKQDEAELDRYLGLLAETDPSNLSTAEQLALYINAYNGATVKLILDNFREGVPVDSIKDIGGFFTSPWGIEFVDIGGKVLSLDDIEHGIIREQFNEPRIHFAVNCASKSCPPLISEPYRAETIDRQLEKSTRDFLSDPSNNYLDGSTLFLSSIFKWYSEDFQDDPVSFVRAHSAQPLNEKLEALGGEIEVDYLDYDWSLNGR